MNFTDMDMLQDYEKDTRMASLAYNIIQTDLDDSNLRKIIGKLAIESAESQKKTANLIIARGDRP